ncbi:MAG: Do family serine endopeptidase [Verrucomicrobiae bacterium]|nr:Do family serine endopeptidase [Verrucomicrobiae bacterium]
MISTRKVPGVLALSMAVLAIAGTGYSQDATVSISYEQLSKKLKIDKEPITAVAPQVATYADALENAMPSVVTIFSTKEVEGQARPPMFDDPMFRKFFGVPEEDLEKMPSHKEQGLGSGVVITNDGYILTNNHVVGGADEIMVSLPSDKKDYKATLIGADPQTDVALIKIEAKGLKPVTIGDSSHLRVGDVTLAVGNPFGLEQTVTLGIVSALGRNDLNITGGGYENFIQTDASINRGNSGGALIDAHGRLIGINTAIQSGISGGNIGIGFAIPVNMSLNIVNRLLDNNGTVKRGFLGVFLKELDSDMAKALGRDDKSGVLITDVGAGTPADKAGLKPGDLVVAYDGLVADSMSKLRLDISNTAPGVDVKFKVIRSGKDKEITVKLGDLSDAGDLAMGGTGPRGGNAPAVVEEKFLEGVEIGDLTDEMRSALSLPEDLKGVVVRDVAADSAAAEAGLRAGHIITQVDQNPVETMEAALALSKNFKGEVLLIQVFVEGRRDILAIPVEK